LTKLEEVIRNKQIKIRSTRMAEELKTFNWIGQTAKAMKGYNDDLVMALAIGMWLYDTNIDYNKHGQEVTKAMLSAFAVNRNDHDENPLVPHHRNPFSPIFVDDVGVSNSQRKQTTFDWLIRR